ncbi:MAG: NAD(P)-dependent oxidoreductase [Planctomycetota bacterium]
MSETKERVRVAVLGLGGMGSRMAGRILGAGHDVTVWNRSAERAAGLVERGASRAATPREAASGADVVLSMVRDDDASRGVWLGADGAAGGLRAGAIALEASTVTPNWIAELARAVESMGAALLEAPVVGSRPQADAGSLITLAAGPRNVFERARSVLDATSGKVVHVGELGHGAAAKLAVNALFASQVSAAAEAIQMLRSCGIADDRWVGLLTDLPIVSPPLAQAIQGIARGRFDPAFPVELVEKDLAYFVETASSSGSISPVASAVRGLFANAIAEGDGGANIHAVARVYERRMSGTG